MAFSLIWSFGYIISIIVFSIIIALGFHLNNSSGKTLTKFIIISLISTSIIIYVIMLFKNQLGSFIGVYNYTLMFLIAFILIFIGYLISKENTFKNTFKIVLLLSYSCFILMTFACILYDDKLLGFNGLQISLFTSVLFNLVILISFFIINKFNLIRNSFNSLKDLYFILGAYFLMVALFIPNIVSLRMEDMKPINIVSVESIVFTLVFIIVIVVLGLVYWRKNTLLK